MPAIVSLMRATRAAASPASTTALAARCSMFQKKKAAKGRDASSSVMTTRRTERASISGTQNAAKSRWRRDRSRLSAIGFGLPAYSDPCRPGHAGVLAAVVRAIVHVGKLHSGLQFQSVSVEVVVRARVRLVVFVSAAGDDAIFVGRQLDAVGVVAFDKRVPPDELKLVGDVE